MSLQDNFYAKSSIGQILVRVQHIMAPGYGQDPENTSAVFQNGWFITGDLAHRDDDGSGRCKNTIIRNGSNVTPEEVEYVLNHHQQVKESIVIGVPDA